MNFRKVLPLFLLGLAFLTPAASAALVTGVHGHATTLLPNGDILVTGGLTDTGVTPVQDAQIYSMAAAAWYSGAPIAQGSVSGGPVARSSHTATLMGDGRVLVAGGIDAAGAPQNNAYLYDPKANTWADTSGSLFHGTRTGHTATLINKGTNAGNVLICGGLVAGTISKSCEIFNKTTKTFGDAADMSSSRTGHTASAITEGRVFVSGGRDSAGTYLSTNEIYDPESNHWQTVDGLNQGRAEHSAVVLNNGMVMITGGYQGVNANAWTCREGGVDTDDECWYIARANKGFTEGNSNRHNPGSHGYVAGAEFFDQNGGRGNLSGLDLGVAPYRFFRHASVLTPDGKHHILDGYGNIAPTYFANSPIIVAGSSINATGLPLSDVTRTIDGTSNIRFPITLTLSREVNGRMVDADAFFSLPPGTTPPTPSIQVANASIYLNYSTAPIDGSPAGKTLGIDELPGAFNDVVKLQSPAGLIVFEPEILTAKTRSAVAVSNLVFSNSPLPSGETSDITGGTLIVPIEVKVPIQYLGGTIRGTMLLSGGTVASTAGLYQWSATMSGSDAIAFTAGPATADPVDKTKAVIDVGNVTFTNVVGSIQNSSEPITSALTVTGKTVTTPKVYTRYTSTLINLTDASYSFDTSTMIVREMIFANDLKYIPNTNTWELTNAKDATIKPPPVSVRPPSFGHSAVLTPAADVVMIGGHNCETLPYTNCLRGTRNFSARTGLWTDINAKVDDWAAIGSLNTKRAFHTTTALPNGYLLACGGANGAVTLSSCELLNPDTRQWSYTGSMNSPRRLHTATLLPNGVVLLAGGAISASTYATNTAEFYDPRSGRCSITDSMSLERANHTATLLPDGNVLVAGGNTFSDTGFGYADSSEIFFTTKTVWKTPIGTGVGVMPMARAQHTATLLKDGNVLVTGGLNGDGVTKWADLYTFKTQSWGRAAADLGTPRYGHTATLLRDGRVLVVGGTNGAGSLKTGEIFDGAVWTPTPNLIYTRMNHAAALLPNGKVMVTGGEIPGTVQGVAESFDPDFPSWFTQGKLTSRADHSLVLTSSGILVAVGGWNGSAYLTATEASYFSYDPDSEGFDPKTTRNPQITGGNSSFNRSERVTLLSDTTNFHGVSEASGGGSGSMNSSFHNPRVYIQAVDSPSGFLTDMTTGLYTLYNGVNTQWANTTSSITMVAPLGATELPYGYYHMRVAANGQFSPARTIQVTMPRPQGKPSAAVPNLASLTWRGVSSITWTWDAGTLPSTPEEEVNAYGVYAASNSVFIGTAAYANDSGIVIPLVTYTQDGLSPNTMASILVNGYNLGGGGPLTASSTYFTLASSPTALTVTGATFNTVTLTWGSNGNSAHTAYQVTMAENNDFTGSFSTAVPFSQNNIDTSATIENLLPNVRYYFRVQAQNGKKGFFGGGGDVPTAYSNSDSTITVSDVSGLHGTALSSTSIKWSWAPAVGAEFYDVYDVTAGTAAALFLGSPTTNAFPQLNLLTNAAYKVAVNAGHSSGGIIRGPVAYSEAVYTMAELPSLGTPEPLAVTTDSIKLFWLRNGNEIGTIYTAEISLTPGFSTATAVSVTASSAAFTGLSPNVLYYGRVTVKNGNGFALAPVELGHMYTLAKTPGNVLVTTISMSGVGLSWEANENSASTTYEVRGTTESSFLISYTAFVPFSQNYHGFTTFVNGLLTSTNYLFEVEARNGDGVKSGPTPAPAVHTLAGPCGTIGGCAPTGSVGGTSNPSRSVTIAGILPSGRGVALTLPANTYASATSIAISSSTNDFCWAYRPLGFPLIEVSIFSANDAQPQAPVTLTFDMTVDESTLIGSYKDRVALARFNRENGDCLPLPTNVQLEAVVPHITADLNHFSVFQLIVIPPASDLNSVQVYPNPFSPGNGYVTIMNLPASSKVRIYSLSGDKVWEGTGNSSGVAEWKGVNTAGRPVASGIYLAVIESSAGRKVKKIAVER